MTAYEMRISDWSSDVCSSDLRITRPDRAHRPAFDRHGRPAARGRIRTAVGSMPRHRALDTAVLALHALPEARKARSEEHTSELQSLMRSAYAVFCMKKKHTHSPNTQHGGPRRENVRNKSTK